MKTILGIALIAAVVAAAVWERDSIGKLRAENEALRAERLEADQLSNENQELPGLRAAPVVTLPEESARSSTELLRLRGEVNRLCAQSQVLLGLRAENQRIAAEIASGKFVPKRLADMEGFVPREQWASAGLATPEGAVQSYLAAVVAADIDSLFRCLTPENAEPIRQQLERDPERFRNEFQKGMAQLFEKATGFRIAERSQISDDSVALSIQFAADGVALPMTLRRIASEWKIAKWE